MAVDPENIARKFQQGDAHVAVIGLGYVGLPLAVLLAQAGYRVTGIDVDIQKVNSVNRGESYIEDIPSHILKSLVHEPLSRRNNIGSSRISTPQDPLFHPEHKTQAIDTAQTTPFPSRGSLLATDDFAVLAECDAVSICVPTPLNKTGDPDISYIVDASRAVAEHLHPGMVVVLESTTYPGTTTEVVLPILQGEAVTKRGGDDDIGLLNLPSHHHIVGKDFFLAFSPERVDPGRKDWTTRNTPKVIGGVTPACLEVAMAFYGQAIETLAPVSSPDAAEMVKLFENTFRMVNIGLANETAVMDDLVARKGIYMDTLSVSDLVNAQRPL